MESLQGLHSKIVDDGFVVPLFTLCRVMRCEQFGHWRGRFSTGRTVRFARDIGSDLRHLPAQRAARLRAICEVPAMRPKAVQRGRFDYDRNAGCTPGGKHPAHAATALRISEMRPAPTNDSGKIIAIAPEAARPPGVNATDF